MRVLVLGAGGPAGVNVCRALHEAGHEVFAHDEKREHLVWTEPYADGGWTLDWDVLMVQPDALVSWLAYRNPERGVFLPKPQTIALCQDKFECGLAWRRAGLREDWIELIDVTRQSSDRKVSFPMWVRARYGAGARCAVCARSPGEFLSWLQFWNHRLGPDEPFIAEGFLPGRDYSWCGIYREGELLVHFARERLEYIYPNLTPEGLTGTPTRAQIVNLPSVDEMAEAAVLAVDEKPHGVFCVDLREDEDGQPRPTEINAGRFSTTVGLWSIYQPQTNFVALAAELALGDEARLEAWEDLPAGLVLSRHIDCGHVFSMAKVPA